MNSSGQLPPWWWYSGLPHEEHHLVIHSGLILDHFLCCSGCKCGFTVSGFNPLCLLPLLLFYTGICHLSIGFPHTAGSSYLCPLSPTDQSILFSAVLKQKQYNNKTHVTLLPRASYPIFEHFGWLGDFLCIVNSG